MHYFSGKGCSESLESMHYCIGILTQEFLHPQLTTQSPTELTNLSSLEIANAPTYLIAYCPLFNRIIDFYRISF